MIKIIPSILTDNHQEAVRILKLSEGVVDRVQIDIIDSLFAENKTIDPSFFEDVETDLKLDYHLMVKEPANWIERCVRGQADRIIGQIELMHNQVSFLGKVQEAGVKAGLAIDLATPVKRLDRTILTSLDVVLVMSVKAGFGGQEFEKSALDKIKELDEIRLQDTTPFVIQDDGGITLEYIDDLRREGADEAVIGKRLFEGDLQANVQKYIKKAYTNK